MILVWNDAASFNRHLELMISFRRSHRMNVKRDWHFFKDMPVLQGVTPRNNAGGINRQFDAGNGPVMFPVKEVTLADNYQN
jgi:hypothetical protein